MGKIYAIIESGGKQYRVEPGKTIQVDRLGVEQGNSVVLDRVLLLEAEGKVTLGRPTVPGAKVIATVLEETRGEKVIVFKYKPKVRYRRKQGHRQQYTRLAIQQIIAKEEGD